MAPPIATILVWLWTLSIALSTLYIHQHNLADVVAGSALGLIVAMINGSTRWQAASDNNAHVT
jgi:membrane-associated phospholipid phosphatase